MVRKGHLERQIEALGMVLAKLLGLKQTNDVAGAQAVIRDACRQLAGMNLDTVNSLNDEALLGLFTAGGALDAGKSVVVATLLGEQAELHEAQGRTAQAHAADRKALMLFAEALLYEDSLRTPEHQARIDALAARLPDDALPASLQHRLFRYHEATGNYARAEDTLFALRERIDDDSIRQEAAAFYRRLLALPDDALSAGGLPRDEVEEGLAEAEASQPG